MEGMKNIFEIMKLLCDKQQDTEGRSTCPACEICEPQLFEEARLELIQNGFDI